MHPPFSVIVFTTLSGAGYGLLFWLGLYGAIDRLPADRYFATVAMITALGTISAGLVASLFHLGHPERAWRALSQWRSSWLSREGVAALITFVPAIAAGAGWILIGDTSGIWAAVWLVTSLCAVVTVFCTASIYRSLKPVAQWHNAWVVPNYLALSAMTGVLLYSAILRAVGGLVPTALELTTIALALTLKLGYWRHIDTSRAPSTPESATGLGALGKVRLFEAPHTSDNYLLKEMGFRFARNHARALRMVSIGFGFLVPALATIAASVASDIIAQALAVTAACAAIVGVLTERWLFFAEARHTVTLYYGR